MTIVLLIILGDAGVCIAAEDVFGNLCEIGPKIVHEVLELMGSCFEMKFEEHVVCDNDGERHPI